MDDRRRVLMILFVVLVGVGIAVSWLIQTGRTFEDLSAAAKEIASRVMWKSIAFALAVAFGLAMLPVSIPATWIAVAAGATLIATGGYEVIQTATGILPAVPQGRQGGGSLPDPCEVGPYTDAHGVVRICNR